MTLLRSFLFLCALFFVSPALAQSCNPPGGFIQSKGTYAVGDVVIFGPQCNYIQDGGPLATGTFRLVTGAGSASTADCNVELLLQGTTYYQFTIGSAASFGSCNLRVRNGNPYTASTVGIGLQLNVSGFGLFNIYPGQSFNFQSDGTNWNPNCPLANDGFGCLWTPDASVNFYVDNTGNNANDGLGPTHAFATLDRCRAISYRQVYTRNANSIQCVVTAGQSFTEFVQIFYPLNGGGTIIYISSVPGTFWNWNCPSSSPCLQFGDNALVGLTDVNMTASPTTPNIIAGHNYGVLDTNSNVRIVNNSVFSSGIGCDYDTHFNINNGLQYAGLNGGANFVFSGCQGSKWNFNGTLAGGSTAFVRFANFPSGSAATFNGNVVFSGSPTGSPMSITGNSVVNNLSGATPPGGVPTPDAKSSYCTSPC